MRIAVDAMGGDHAPDEIVPGCVKAAREIRGINRLVLVGDQSRLEDCLAAEPQVPACIEIVHASEVVGMGDAPAMALRRKKDSSIARALELVKAGEADAVFSAGSTGAAVAGATLKLRALEGVSRPAIATIMPTQRHPFVMLDSGANTDCTPLQLCQFAAMGHVYAKEILGIPEPRIGLLSIGGEEAKGNDTTKQTFKLLEQSRLNFIGNVESHDLFEGAVDVCACDGFVGNVVLKTCEAVAQAMSAWLRSEFTASLPRKLGAAMLKPAFAAIKTKSDPEQIGGAPLLGTNGLVLIGHGSSSRIAVFNALRIVTDSFEHDINHHIIDEVAALPRLQSSTS